MIRIYRVSQNFNKPIQELEVESINNDDGTFLVKNYFKYNDCVDKIYKISFIPKKDKMNQPTFFIKYEDAKKFYIEKLNNKIQELTTKIKNYSQLLNNLK
jgi:hypothetical protein